MTAKEIEITMAHYFGIRHNIIVPNVHWGMFNHECDLLILSKSNYATEVEIKISLSDLKKDKLKKHNHYSDKIKYLYFAIPAKLAKYIEHIPKHAGIFIITKNKKVFCIAKPVQNKHAFKFVTKDILQLLRLGNMRTWLLREKLLEKELCIKEMSPNLEN